jgi:hypothetical protein
MSQFRQVLKESLPSKWLSLQAWQRAEGKNPKGGLNAKGRASAKAQGMNLKPPVKKAEAAKSPKSAGRRKSFCVVCVG